MTTTSVPAIERMRVPLPRQFDLNRHKGALMTALAKDHGDGWELDSIEGSTAVVSRQSTVTTVTASTTRPHSFDVKLPGGTKPADGERFSTRLADQYAEHDVVMTRFEPFLGRATLSRLDEATLRCRGAVSVALGVKAWDVQVVPRTDGGFELELPRSYVSSKHYDKLYEVATDVVGTVGWRVKVKPQSLTAVLIPGDPPVFPPVVPYPLETLGDGDWDHTTLGVLLPDEGEGAGSDEVLDWTASAWALIAGTPGSGKTNLLNSLIAQQVSAGASLVICDESSKAVDFAWARTFVRDGGWGCDSEAHVVTALALVYEEGQRRAKILGDQGVVNWLDLPMRERFKPIFIVVDELSALTVSDPVPKGVPKDHPIVVEINQLNFLRALIGRFINKIIAEQRFVGIRMVLSTQVTNATTGLPPSLKNKIGHRVLAGTNPSKTARNQAFNDESSVVEVPDHVQSSGSRGRGVGVADLEGHTSVVFKSYFATTADYGNKLRTLGAPTTTRPAPTAAEVAKHAPDLVEEEEAEERSKVAKPRSSSSTPSGKPLDPKFGPALDPETGEPLTGFAKANAARHELAKDDKTPAAAAASAASAPMCPACDKPIDLSTGECGCTW